MNFGIQSFILRGGTMKARGETRVVLVTCGTLNEARRIAREIVTDKLAACVNVILSPIESFYTWKGKLERAREFLLVMKTTKRGLPRLEEAVKSLHSYDVPEFIALPANEGSRDYLAWVKESVVNAQKKR
jgi:periplasmic divalent cation tolerance protein